MKEVYILYECGGEYEDAYEDPLISSNSEEFIQLLKSGMEKAKRFRDGIELAYRMKKINFIWVEAGEVD